MGSYTSREKTRANLLNSKQGRKKILYRLLILSHDRIRQTRQASVNLGQPTNLGLNSASVDRDSFDLIQSRRIDHRTELGGEAVVGD